MRADYNEHKKSRHHHHQVAFCAVGLGLALCVLACASPFWFTGKVRTSDGQSSRVAVQADDNIIPLTKSLTDTIESLDVTIGLWWYCVDLYKDYKCSYIHSLGEHNRDNPELRNLPTQDDDPTYVFFIRWLMGSCLALALVGLLTVCFYCCTCCKELRALGYGVLFFVTGLLGFAAVFLLTFKVDVLIRIPVSHIAFGWAFPLFIAGDCIIIVASFTLCLFRPKQDCPSYYETIVSVSHLINQDELLESQPNTRALAIREIEY